MIFTSGCTGALKLVAESFDFHDCHCSCCHGNKVQDRKQEICNVTVTSEDEDLLSSSGHGEGSEMDENSRDLSNANENRCECGCHGSSSFGCYGNDSIGRPKRGSFVYLLDNHTSVQGMREIAFTRAGRVSCVDCDKDAMITKEHVLYQNDNYQTGGNSLFAYPAQSNFSGKKYPMEWISKAQKGELGRMTLGEGHEGRCYVVLDAACLVSTSLLDLRCYKPDFVTLSFYKMFGYPTGLGKNWYTVEWSKVLLFTYEPCHKKTCLRGLRLG